MRLTSCSADRNLEYRCRIFLGKDEVDHANLFVIDEAEGYLEFGAAFQVVRPNGLRMFRWVFPPGQREHSEEMVVRYRAYGDVRIELKPDAPPAIVAEYAARRAAESSEG